MDDLYGQTCDRCGGFSNAAEHRITFSPDALDKGLHDILSGFDVKNDIQRDIFRETLRLFNRAAARGISESYDEKAITDEFLEQIRHNNEVFSVFKTHKMQNEIAGHLLDGDGRLKSYEQFRRDVAPLTGKYCGQWLNTEYNTAVIRAHRAADWKHFEGEKDIYPRLKWLKTTSATPDPIHRRFWEQNLVLDVEAPFWRDHQPGERWGCKCSCEQTDEPANDPFGVSGGNGVRTSSKGLAGNPAETGKLFSEDHPYYPESCSACPFNRGVKNRLRAFFNKKKDCSTCTSIGNVIRRDNAIYDIGESLVKLYDLNKEDFGKEVRRIASSKMFKRVEKSIFSAIGQEDNDYDRLLTVARKASIKGYTSFILPNPSRGRTPDIILSRNGVFKVYDVKTIVGNNSVSSRLADSVGQTHRVILHITTDYNPREMAKEIKKFLNKNPNAVEVLVFRGNKQISVTPNMLTHDFEKAFVSRYNR